MHYMGHGKAVELAKSLHAGLAESKTPLDKPSPPAPAAEPPAFVKTGLNENLDKCAYYAVF
jgi:hypothetical protein